MICPNCQKEIPDTAKYCGYCGQLLVEIVRKRWSWLWISAGGGGLVFIVGLAAILIFWSFGEDSSEADIKAVYSPAPTEVVATSPAETPTTARSLLLTPRPATPTSTKTVTPRPTPTPTKTVELWDAIVIASSVSIRGKPDPLFAAIIDLDQGQGVDLLAINPDRTWVKVRAFDKNSRATTGWVQIDFLELNVSLNSLSVEKVATISTATFTPTSSPTPTHTPRPTSTTQPTAIPPAPAPSPVTSSPTPISGNVAQLAPVLLAPSEDETISRNQLTNFQWKWPGELPENSTFEIRIWQEGIDQDHYGAYDVRDMYSRIQKSQDGVYQVDFDVSGAYAVQLRPTEANFMWTVAVVTIDPYARIGPEAEPQSLTVGLAAGTTGDCVTYQTPIGSRKVCSK